MYLICDDDVWGQLNFLNAVGFSYSDISQDACLCVVVLYCIANLVMAALEHYERIPRLSRRVHFALYHAKSSEYNFQVHNDVDMWRVTF